MASDTRTRTSTSKHILPGEWERHRDRIVGLRRSGTILEGDDGIMAIMKREHGFVASVYICHVYTTYLTIGHLLSSSQYELQLNKWAERKNLHAEEWRQIIQTVDQYNEDGIHCDVYRNGQLIPRWTLKRKRKEYCQGHDEPVSVKGVQGRGT
ncbi:uncharacterized protein A1O5_06117 [Cladophialophora psammophila CBS 110553]|uniref:Clr5 domain-containing protein n=1 Tax=Cladophialophora psammophila CBS 110553 TaxID=1182543 RepID=W9WT50_9EURO|nr:uncharacterized protein A1O5_06117 [Cladophialophora psammophila CBS 110553]EXJ71123.1 hypothetical protein A1O5_06117 [Cladophialophora psammophila CBS 110553]